jgi:hypothetical protein
MTHYEQMLMLAEHLTIAEKAQLLEYLSTSLKHDLETEAYKRMPWEQFVNLTYGSLADDPLERLPQPEADIRDEIE